MEALIAGSVAGLTIAAAWFDLRKRTNGHGPLAQKIDRLDAKVEDALHWQSDHLDRWHRN